MHTFVQIKCKILTFPSFTHYHFQFVCLCVCMGVCVCLCEAQVETERGAFYFEASLLPTSARWQVQSLNDSLVILSHTTPQLISLPLSVTQHLADRVSL